MTTNASAIAQAEQLRASDPRVCAFVSASAGSGKTKLLTDRLLRLMLAGAHPGRIQCLTYTKAGAAEMAVRLQRMLGAWVTAPTAVLQAELRALTLEPDEALCTAARQLFGRVLDLPGGMRIGTIHAFCQSLLRRFPLEAALSPRFELLDQVATSGLQQAARESALAGPEADTAAIGLIAPQLAVDRFGTLIGELQNRRERLDQALAHGMDALVAAQRRVLKVQPGLREDDILRAAIDAMDLPRLREAMRIVAATKNKNVLKRAPAALTWLAEAPPANLDDWHTWARYFIKADSAPYDYLWLICAPSDKANPGLRDFLLEEQARICAVLGQLKTLRLAELSAAMLRLAAPALSGYDAAKAELGRLDYADLIARANALLREPGAAWVLYKLDGGLDHLLLDEVQDTAPDQWRIADAITAEFFAGSGAYAERATTDLARSIFAVGDQKQSIFSFQGAAPDSFDTWRDTMARRTTAAGCTWRDVSLEVSFRSTTPVLALVDAVFADADRMGVPAVRHVAARAGHAGCVELWPLAPLPPKAAPAPWSAEAAPRPEPSGAERVAKAVADWIALQTNGSVELKSRGRPLHAGDILVLVRNRGPFDQALLRALKAGGVPVAGLDRMALTEQPAVADLLALCDTLLLPSDDLSLATVLTSPLGGLTDASLMALALGRRGTLWNRLQARAGERAEWGAAHGFVAALFGRVDYVSPHALLCEALGARGGRARLFARLGPQAAEAIDELLSMALGYEAAHVPSLQGFVHWLRESGAEVKREAEGAARALRIMTVHGAKGLQAPMVILPASFGLATKAGKLVWAADPDGGGPVPLWGPRKETHDTVMAQTASEAVDAERAEHYRLLYVALTRAEDRLVVCGWQTPKSQQDCWYDLVADSFAALPDLHRVPFAQAGWEGERLSYATDQVALVEPDVVAAAGVAAVLPDWMGASCGWRPGALPDEPVLPAPLAPSRPQDAAFGLVPHAASPLAERDASGRRFARGQLLHSLLQHLPGVPPASRAAVARRYLVQPARFVTPAEADGLVDELMGLMADPALAPLFGPGSRAEVPLTGVIDTPEGPRVVGGLVDRLVALPDRVLVADYKTNRDPPAAPPALYVRQMAAYRAVLRAIFPGRPIRCALIWTRTGRVDWLDDDDP